MNAAKHLEFQNCCIEYERATRAEKQCPRIVRTRWSNICIETKHWLLATHLSHATQTHANENRVEFLSPPTPQCKVDRWHGSTMKMPLFGEHTRSLCVLASQMILSNYWGWGSSTYCTKIHMNRALQVSLSHDRSRFVCNYLWMVNEQYSDVYLRDSHDYIRFRANATMSFVYFDTEHLIASNMRIVHCSVLDARTGYRSRAVRTPASLRMTLLTWSCRWSVHHSTVAGGQLRRYRTLVRKGNCTCRCMYRSKALKCMDS